MYFDDLQPGMSVEIAPGVMSFMSVWARYLENDFFGSELLAGKPKKPSRRLPKNKIKKISLIS